jgi:acetyl esterase/lipase
VISLRVPHAHVGSGRNLIGDDRKDQKLYEDLSNENNVTARTPPTFLVHTTEDTGVKPDNSIVFYQALVKNKVPAELHIYEKGQHGLGLGPKHLPFSTWPQRCAAWLAGQGMLKKSE